MTIAEELRRELDRLDASGGQQMDRISLDTGHGQLVCELAALDRIGCTLQSICYETNRFAASTTEQLKQLGETLSGRLSYLMEPISPIEIDPNGCTVQLRSNPPQKSECGTYYFELLIRLSEGISLCRYCQRPGQPRCSAPADVTREVLLRLADDLTRDL